MLAEAVKDASSKAEQLADGLGVRITGVQSSSISEAGYPQVYYAAVSAFAEEKPAEPVIEPGETTVSLSVQVTYLVE